LREPIGVKSLSICLFKDNANHRRRHWFHRMKDAGIDSLGMHLEAVTERVRMRIMPGKAQVSVERYFRAFDASVRVFGRGQVSTYILAGLGDTKEEFFVSAASR